MSAIHHHRPYNPAEIEEFEAAITEKIEEGRTLAAQLYDTHRQRLAGRQPNPPAWRIRKQIERLEEELDLLLSELDRRRI